MSGTSMEQSPSDGAGSGDDHGVVEVAQHGAVVAYNPDAPSEEWGWHGHFSDFAPRGRFLLLGLGVAGLLLMLIGNHVSNVENYFLILTAMIMIAWMTRSWMARKRDRRIRP